MSISGSVMYYTGAVAVSDSVLMLAPSGATTRTAEDGSFALSGSPERGHFTLRAEKEGDFRSAVSSLDAVYILQHVVGDRELSDSQRRACDVTGDGQVTALDATRVLELSVGEIERFAVAGACRSDWLFSIDGKPLSCDQPVEIEPHESLKIEALLAGDCTGNWRGDGSVARQVGVGRVRSVPRVRVGRLRVRGTRALLPIYVRASMPYNSLDLDIEYAADELSPTRTRVLGDRNGGLIQVKSGPDGKLAMAIANPSSINRGRRQAIVLEFEMLPGFKTGEVRLGGLRIDEKAPRISHLRR